MKHVQGKHYMSLTLWLVDLFLKPKAQETNDLDSMFQALRFQDLTNYMMVIGSGRVWGGRGHFRS